MKMTNDEKAVYNGWVKRLKDAKAYMDDNTKTIEEREKFIPQLEELMRDMNTIAKEFKLTEEEIENGFR